MKSIAAFFVLLFVVSAAFAQETARTDGLIIEPAGFMKKVTETPEGPVTNMVAVVKVTFRHDYRFSGWTIKRLQPGMKVKDAYNLAPNTRIGTPVYVIPGEITYYYEIAKLQLPWLVVDAKPK